MSTIVFDPLADPHVLSPVRRPLPRPITLVFHKESSHHVVYHIADAADYLTIVLSTLHLCSIKEQCLKYCYYTIWVYKSTFIQ